MKDKMIKAALSFAVLCGLGACTKNYLDINSNPYEVDKEQMEAKDYAIASGLSAMFGTVVSTDVNTAQFTDCLLGSTQGGYYADANNGWTNTISNTTRPTTGRTCSCTATKSSRSCTATCRT